MVSTRKERFSEGDRVLCYEPDLTKAKVLYDSKVLEVKGGKDERGRRSVEYLIHFQGWNSSWDRLVNEDFVLKDTHENRQLQRDLAAKARLQLGSYLYRKDPRDKDGTTLSEKVFEAGNSCSSQEEALALEDEYLTATDDDNASSVETDDSLEQKVPLELSPAIRHFLETDYQLINAQHKLVRLPSSPTVIEILEAYIRHLGGRAFRTDGSESPRPRGRGQPAAPLRPANKAEELERVSARVNLAKETVDGLRICFDFYLGSQLLYASEQLQFEQMKAGLFTHFRADMRAFLSEDETTKSDDPFISSRSGNVHLSTDTGEGDRKRSLRSHQKDAPMEPGAPSSSAASAGAASPAPPALANGSITKLTAKNLVLLGNQNSPNNCMASGRSVSSTASSSYCGPLAGHSAHLAGGPLAPEMARLVTLTTGWKLVPDSYLCQLPPPPSAIYGPIHLCRLFVKLPSFIYAANLPENENEPRHLSEHKLKLLLNHLQSFLTFLEGKSEWFGESHYFSDVKMES